MQMVKFFRVEKSLKGQKMIFRVLPSNTGFSSLYPETPVPYTVPRSNFYLPGWEPTYETNALVRSCLGRNLIISN